MKSFSALLEDHTRPGVYLLKTMPPVKEMEQQAIAKGFAFFHIEGQKIEKKEQFLNHSALVMHFPEHFGNNWDAFEDFLTDLSWIDDGKAENGYVILFDHFDPFAEHHESQLETVVEIFQSATQYWHDQGKAMFVLLHGKGGKELELKTI